MGLSWWSFFPGVRHQVYLFAGTIFQHLFSKLTLFCSSNLCLVIGLNNSALSGDRTKREKSWNLCAKSVCSSPPFCPKQPEGDNCRSTNKKPNNVKSNSNSNNQRSETGLSETNHFFFSNCAHTGRLRKFGLLNSTKPTTPQTNIIASPQNKQQYKSASNVLPRHTREDDTQ